MKKLSILDPFKLQNLSEGYKAKSRDEEQGTEIVHPKNPNSPTKGLNPNGSFLGVFVKWFRAVQRLAQLGIKSIGREGMGIRLTRKLLTVKNHVTFNWY